MCVYVSVCVYACVCVCACVCSCVSYRLRKKKEVRLNTVHQITNKSDSLLASDTDHIILKELCEEQIHSIHKLIGHNNNMF